MASLPEEKDHWNNIIQTWLNTLSKNKQTFQKVTIEKQNWKCFWWSGRDAMKSSLGLMWKVSDEHQLQPLILCTIRFFKVTGGSKYFFFFCNYIEFGVYFHSLRLEVIDYQKNPGKMKTWDSQFWKLVTVQLPLYGGSSKLCSIADKSLLVPAGWHFPACSGTPRELLPVGMLDVTSTTLNNSDTWQRATAEGRVELS